MTTLRKLRIHHEWFLFGMTPGGDSYFHHFGAINKQQIGEQSLKLESALLIFIYTNVKFIVICNPGLLMTIGEDSSLLPKTHITPGR